MKLIKELLEISIVRLLVPLERNQILDILKIFVVHESDGWGGMGNEAGKNQEKWED